MPAFRTLVKIVFVSTVLLGTLPLSTFAQSDTVALQGFVEAAETGQPLVGANVVAERLGADRPPQGTAAGENGFYVLDDLAPGRYALRVSFVGYRAQRDTLRLTGEEGRVTHSVELRAAEKTLEDVVVTDQHRGATTQQAGRQRVAPEDIGRVPTPSVSGDLATYLQSMPGIVSVGDQGGQLYIRGGTPDQNLILMDKMPVFRPFHIVGFYSAFPQELVANADVYAGGFPAQYSGRISSVIDVQMRGGNQEHLEAAVTAGPLLTGIRAEGPLNDEGLSVIGSARFSQIERTAPFLLGQEKALRFNDQYLKLQGSSERGRCGFTSLHTYDRGRIDPDSDDVFRWSNYAFGGRCVTAGTESATLLDASIHTSYVGNAVGTRTDPEREADLLNVGSRLNVSSPLAGEHSVKGGLRFHFYELGYSLGEKFQGFETSSETWISLNGYLEGTFALGKRLDVRPGLAVSFPVGYGPSFEPRLRAQWRPFGSEREELSAALGFYRQTVAGLSDERDLGSVFTAWVPAPLDRKRPSALHAILGWKQRMGPVAVTVEGYYKDLSNLAVPAWSPVARFTTDLVSAEGTSWGGDVRVEYERGAFYTYLSYGFSRTKYIASQDNFGVWFGTEVQSYHPPHDRRHEVNAVVSTDLGFATADLRWQFGSGLPYTQPFGFDSFLRLRRLANTPHTYGTPRLLFEKPYRARLPAYHRLDVSLERTFDLDPVQLTIKGGTINLYDRQNLFYFDLFTLRRVNQLPLVPFLALKVEI